MALDSTHPYHDAFAGDWTLMRHAYAGERVVKAQGTVYLPATPGQTLDGLDAYKPGAVAYDGYKARAIFPDFVSDAVEAYVGLLNQKAATFELPSKMKDMEASASISGESLMQLLRRIHEQQLVAGRVGLLLDLPLNPDPSAPLPYISLYIAEAVRNWDDSDDKEGQNKLNLVVLDESAFERQANFNWKRVEKYRILQMGIATTAPDDAEEESPAASQGEVYLMGVFNVTGSASSSVDMSQMKIPMLRGVPLTKIPFVFVNSKDIVPTPDNPPLLGLARLSYAIYRGEADYRQTLFMQSQDTLVTIGGLIENRETDGSVRVGAGARIDMNLGGDAKYVGIGAVGLPEMRICLENDTKKAQAKSGQLIAPAAGKQESGDALQTRLAAQTATLNQIALTSAAALETLLKIAAEWMGANPEEVKVIPNLEFADPHIDGRSFVELMSARSMGAPISLQSIHELAVDKGLTKLSFQDEMDRIAEEDADRATKNKGLGLDPNGDVIPPAPLKPTAAPGNSPPSA